MRLLTIAIMLALAFTPVMAGCGAHGQNSPENPTIVLGLLGGSVMMWRYARARLASKP